MASAPSALGHGVLPTPSPGDSTSTGGAQPSAPAFVPDPMRAYRACLHCRSRKTKCTLDINGGQPPCRRCQREGRECVLGESHRGGRRVRKKPAIVEDSPNSQGPKLPPIQDSITSNPEPDYHQPAQQRTSNTGAFNGQFESRFPWQNDGTHTPDVGSYPRAPDHTSPHTTVYSSHNYSPPNEDLNRSDRRPVTQSIASADLQNPSDALEILARVADRAEESPDDGRSPNPHPSHELPMPWKPPPSPMARVDHLHYKPVIDGILSPDMVYHLFATFESLYYPFFPIVPRETFDPQRIPWTSKSEPHLFSAILTIASKDDERIHQICYDHMQHLVSLILSGTDADLEAVEALLLLSQWVSHRPQVEIAVGRGEEDRVAWMYIGTALRLAYFLGIDRAAFKGDSNENPAAYNRKRLVWSACYVADRAVSVRLGKGFWARGPGPLSGIQAADFPTLQPRHSHDDNFGMIFEANLGLTQIFSNVHDILYSSKGHGWKEMLEGRYAKYLDDFRMSIRSWDDKWGDLECSPRLKGSLILTFQYLRLYVNAFAYQATISRAMVYSKEVHPRSIPLIDAAAPDARFIYDAVDAAISLLRTFTTFIEVETLRYMPCRFILIIVYSAVFLYKARLTTTMSTSERSSIRELVDSTISRLHQSSRGPNHMGNRYSLLLTLLWRKSPKRTHNEPRDILTQPVNTRLQIPPPHSNSLSPQHQHLYPDYPSGSTSHPNLPPLLPNDMHHGHPTSVPVGPAGGFSWLDLGATWNFATRNNGSGTGGSGSGDEMDLMTDSAGTGVSPYGGGMNLNLMTDYSLLNDNNPNLIF